MKFLTNEDWFGHEVHPMSVAHTVAMLLLNARVHNLPVKHLFKLINMREEI